MRYVCDVNACVGCHACADRCPCDAITITDGIASLNAIIDEDVCVRCGMCERVCQVNNPLPLSDCLAWYQGWATGEPDRKDASSGGFAYALSKQIVLEGGVVASCEFVDGEFVYTLSDSLAQLDRKRGSKYVKSDPSGIYQQVRTGLDEGRQVLFIGLPCHVGALKRYLDREYDNLYTVDLICHGTPSPKVLDAFLKDYGITASSLQSLSFRDKTNFNMSCVLEGGQEFGFTAEGVKDRYTIAFLRGLTYTENCYACHYAGTKRVSDITIGDSWGSDLDEVERRSGISLALCQTEKGVNLLKRCKADLREVDVEKAVEANQQLRIPTPVPWNRNLFFRSFGLFHSFRLSMLLCHPKTMIRLGVQDLQARRRAKNAL